MSEGFSSIFGVEEQDVGRVYVSIGILIEMFRKSRVLFVVSINRF